MSWRTMHPHDHSWVVPSGMLADEPARRAWLAHVRRELAQTGRVKFVRHHPNAYGLIHYLPPVTMVLVRGCVTDHGGPR